MEFAGEILQEMTVISEITPDKMSQQLLQTFVTKESELLKIICCLGEDDKKYRTELTT